MRKRIYRIIEQARADDKASLFYDIIMLLAIAASIIPLMFVEEYPIFRTIEQVTVSLFILDYLLRWITADYRIGKGKWSFVLYPFTGWAIIDLLSILPGLNILGRGFKVLRITRMLKIIRIFKFIRYSENIQVLVRVLRKKSSILLTVLGISIFYVFLTALVMFNAEPHINPQTGVASFETFFDALYWATVTLTTVGYGDMIPVTDLGRFISMLSSLFGVAIIALPSGIITASYMEELRSIKEEKSENSEEKDPSK